MKKYNLISTLLIFAILSIATISCKDSGSSINTDTIGEADSLSPQFGKKSENVAKAIINGQEMTFEFVDMGARTDTTIFSESNNGAYTMWGIELGSNEKMKEKIAIILLNHNFAKEKLPYTIPKGAQAGKQARIDLSVQKSNVFIPYGNLDNIECTITKFDDFIEGTFAGEVRNLGNKVIKIEQGTFKARVKKIEMRVQ
jgi:hypothetical protein